MIKIMLNLLILNHILFCNIVKRINVKISTSLQGFTVFNLGLVNIVLILEDLGFSHFYLFFPTRRTIESLIIFTKIEASVIKRFIKVFSSNIFTNFHKLFSADPKFIDFLLDSRKQDILCQFWILHEDIPHILIGIEIINNFLN